MLLYTYLEVEENRILTSVSNAYNKEANFFLLHNLMRRVRRKSGSQFDSLRSLSLNEIEIK